MRISVKAALLASAAALGAGAAQAQVIIDNGTIQLGVNPRGNLITGGIGLTFLPTDGEALAPGCDCEGWGVGDFVAGSTSSNRLSPAGWAGQSFGFSSTIDAGTVTASGMGTDAASVGDSAVAVAVVTEGAFNVQVTHTYRPSASPNLYEVDVLIENLSTTDAVGNLVYRRAMDWDIPPTEFDEYVTLQGWPATRLFRTSDDGFITGDINYVPTSIGSDNPPVNGNFTNSGPDDHGAVFDFSFGALAPGATQDLTIFYGAAPSEADALLALAAVQAEVYSLGKPSSPGGLEQGIPNTFIFGFAGVGGTPVGPMMGAPVAQMTELPRVIGGAMRGGALGGVMAGGLGLLTDRPGPDEGIRDWTVHAFGVGSTGSFDAVPGSPGFDYDFAGAGVAIDRTLRPEGGMVTGGVVGLQFGFGSGSADLDGAAGDTDITSYNLMAYGRATTTYDVWVEALVDGGWHDFDTTRVGLLNVYSGSTDGMTFGGLVRVGHEGAQIDGLWAFGTVTRVSPYAEVSVLHTDIDGYTENNNGMIVGGFDNTRTDVGVGARMTTFKDYGAYTAFGGLDVGVIFNAGGAGYTVDQATVGGAPVARRVGGYDDPMLRLNAAVGGVSGNTWGVTVEYTGLFSGDLNAGHALSLRGRLAF